MSRDNLIRGVVFAVSPNDSVDTELLLAHGGILGVSPSPSFAVSNIQHSQVVDFEAWEFLKMPQVVHTNGFGRGRFWAVVVPVMTNPSDAR